MTRELLIFPFGLIVLSILGIIFFLIFVRDIFELGFSSRLGEGITEYPSMVSVLLYGSNEDTLTFSSDGRKVILEHSASNELFMDTNSLRKRVTEIMRSGYEESLTKFIEFISVEDCTRCIKTGKLQVTITIPDEVVRNKEYIENEIANLGRVLIRNTGNDVRWLLCPDSGERRVKEVDGEMLVYIKRRQLVPGWIGERSRRMSERQITRNIRNRLWNRFEVNCVSIDKYTYCGEIVASKSAA